MESGIDSSYVKNDNSLLDYSVDYSGASSVHDILNLSMGMINFVDMCFRHLIVQVSFIYLYN